MHANLKPLCVIVILSGLHTLHLVKKNKFPPVVNMLHTGMHPVVERNHILVLYRTVLKYKNAVLVLHLSTFIFCYNILLLHYISEKNINIEYSTTFI